MMLHRITCTVLFLFFAHCAVTFAQTNFWEKLNGPQDRHVASVAVNSRGDIFSLSNGIIYRSTDEGLHWIDSSAGFLAFSSLAFNKSDDIFISTWGNGVYKSTDNGKHWEKKCDSTTTDCIAINDKGYIFAGSLNGVYRSTDNGESWVSFRKSPTMGRTLSIVIDKQNRIYVGNVFTGVFLSTDNGEHWNETGLNDQWIRVLSLVTNSDGHILTGVGNGDFIEIPEVYRSIDNGLNWQKISTDLPSSLVRTFAIKDVGHVFAGTNDDGVYYSSNNGDRWKSVNSGLTSLNIINLIFHPNGYLYAGTWDGVYRSTNPITSMEEPQRINQSTVYLNQNYPNPFGTASLSRSTSTSITFSLPKPTHVTLKIFNALGQEIHRLIDNEFYEEGKHSVEFAPRTSHLALRTSSLSPRRVFDAPRSGVYFYQIIASDFIETKKMIVIQ